jgi:putative transposase
VDAFKSITTVKYIQGVKTKGWERFDGRLWQRDYYEHIIRNEFALNNIANYIIDNPRKWNENHFRT